MIQENEVRYLKFVVILTVHRRYYVEIKCQLDATDLLHLVGILFPHNQIS